MRIGHIETKKPLETGPYVKLYRRWQDSELDRFTASVEIPGNARILYPNVSAWIKDRFSRHYEMANIVVTKDMREPWLDR